MSRIDLGTMVKRKGRYKIGMITELFKHKGVEYATVKWGDPMGYEFMGKSSSVPVSELGEVLEVQHSGSKYGRVNILVDYGKGHIREKGEKRKRIVIPREKMRVI